MSSSKRPRILLVTRNLPPLIGGMERLNWHIARELAQVGSIRVVGPAGSAALIAESVVAEDVPLSPLPRFLMAALSKACGIARSWRPALVLAGSGLTAPIALIASRLCGARCAVYLHGLDIAVRHRVYRALWLPAIRRIDIVIVNSRSTRAMAIEAGVDPGRIRVVHPGVDLSKGEADPSKEIQVRVKHSLGQRTILLSVGRFSRRKGLLEFVTQVFPKIVADHPQVVLLIVGDAPKQALHAEAQTRETILSAAVSNGTSDFIRFVGSVSDEELETLYRTAALHVFPVQDIPGDPEGFGMVAIEAAAHGLPTVAYATGGVVDAVETGVSGRLVTSGDNTGMAKAILDMLEGNDGVTRESCMEFAGRFAWPKFGGRLFDALQLASPRGN